MIATHSRLWQYLSPEQQQLDSDGQVLIEERKAHPNERLSDYSYLVFPFAKLYEGFLKQLFRDLSIIEDRDYRSDHFRIGKALSPNLARRLGNRSAYEQVSKRFGSDLADSLWHVWKEGRNLVFHYFPHNLRALKFDHAVLIIQKIVDVMEKAVEVTKVMPQPHKKPSVSVRWGKGESNRRRH